jgi:hypothetical protein
MTAAGISSDQPVIAPPNRPEWRKYLSLHAATLAKAVCSCPDIGQSGRQAATNRRIGDLLISRPVHRHVRRTCAGWAACHPGAAWIDLASIESQPRMMAP